MKVMLTGVSQSVSFARKDETLNFLDFAAEDGRKLQLEVPYELVQKVLDFMHGEEEVPESVQKDAEVVPSPVPEGANVFGGEEPTLEEGDGDEPDVVHVPQTEEQVPSI